MINKKQFAKEFITHEELKHRLIDYALETGNKKLFRVLMDPYVSDGVVRKRRIRLFSLLEGAKMERERVK